ncbi:hypothetical protein ABZ357_28215 [Streptomyces sp. NPDC005917]|uniref:hypothetical protein n=1 Tax=unclassified Streptomyces TaxID=2593676 RepID=UPI0033D07BD1
MMRLTGRAPRLTVHIGEDDTRRPKPLFLPQLGELVTEGLGTLDDCEVIRHAGRTAYRGKTDAKGKKSL